MSGFELEMPESFDTGGSFLQEAGTYHLAVLSVDEQPTSKDGSKMLDGFRVDVEVLGGPHAKKQAELMFFRPKLTDKNGGEMAKKKQGRFVVATGVVAEAKPGEKVTVDLAKAVGRQLIATFAKRPNQDGTKEFLDLNFADIWHVDDPSAPSCEKNQQALGLLPKGLRRTAESFGQNGNGKTAAATAAATPPAAAPASLDDL